MPRKSGGKRRLQPVDDQRSRQAAHHLRLRETHGPVVPVRVVPVGPRGGVERHVNHVLRGGPGRDVPQHVVGLPGRGHVHPVEVDVRGRAELVHQGQPQRVARAEPERRPWERAVVGAAEHGPAAHAHHALPRHEPRPQHAVLGRERPRVLERLALLRGKAGLDAGHGRDCRADRGAAGDHDSRCESQSSAPLSRAVPSHPGPSVGGRPRLGGTGPGFKVAGAPERSWLSTRCRSRTGRASGPGRSPPGSARAASRSG